MGRGAWQLLLQFMGLHSRTHHVHSSTIYISQDMWFSQSVMAYSLRPHGLYHARLSWPSLSPGAHSNSCLLCWWCHSAISSSVSPFSSCLQSVPASGSFPMSQLFTSGGQSVGASASVLPMNIQGWFLLGLSGLIFQSKELSRVFEHYSSKVSILQCSAFFIVQVSHVGQ